MKRQQHLAIEIFTLCLDGTERDKLHAAALIRKLTPEARRDLRATLALVTELMDDTYLRERSDSRAIEELRKCARCGHTWPVSELDGNGVCPDCLLPPVD